MAYRSHHSDISGTRQRGEQTETAGSEERDGNPRTGSGTAVQQAVEQELGGVIKMLVDARRRGVGVAGKQALEDPKVFVV